MRKQRFNKKTLDRIKGEEGAVEAEGASQRRKSESLQKEGTNIAIGKSAPALRKERIIDREEQSQPKEGATSGSGGEEQILGRKPR